MNRVYTVLILILMIPMSAYAEGEAEPSLNEDNSDDYLLSDIGLVENWWEPDLDLTSLESPWIDVSTLCDILLEFCLDMGVADEEICETLDLWEPDYEPYLFYEDDWYYYIDEQDD